MIKAQMELAFEHTRPSQPRSRRQRRLSRARWWFEQMRQVVDRALDRPAPHGRPEQIYLGIYRELRSN